VKKPIQYSNFGRRFSQGAGIVGLMDDLGIALNENPELIFMGGGNPGQILEVEHFFQQKLIAQAQDPDWLHACLGVYQSPQGDRDFRISMAQMLSQLLGKSLTAENIAIANGSQSIFFMLFNMLAGETQENNQSVTRHIHLPLVPEYIGYTDAGLQGSIFKANLPKIEVIGQNRFKYQVDFENLHIDQNLTAALCVSRPTNPTGNMITDQELIKLNELASTHSVPLIIDGAYGLPFPDLVFSPASPFFSNNTILVLSLSKLGLPGVRTGILVAEPEIIAAFTHANTVTSLACGNIGPYLVRDSLKDSSLLELCRTQIKPFYLKKMQQALDAIDHYLEGIDYRVHQPEGAIFLWLWFPKLSISCQKLYERLKNRGMLIVAGHHFFPGLDIHWPHKHECIRISYAQPFNKVEQGIKLLATELKNLS